MWYVVGDVGDEYHLADRACGGVAKKSEVYSVAEIELFDIKELKDSKDDIWHRMLLSRHLQHKGTNDSYSESIDIFDDVLKLNPDELTALFHRSFALMRIQLFEASLLGLNYASKLDNTTYEIPYLIGQVLLYKSLTTPVSNRKELFEKAAIQLNRSLEITPNRHETIAMLSSCLRHLEKYDEITAKLNSIGKIEDERTRNDLYLIRAEAYAKSKIPDIDKSLQDFQHVHDNSDKDLYQVCAILNISIIHSSRPDVEKRNPNAAIEVLKSLNGNPYFIQNTSEYLFANGLAYLSNGDFDQANTYVQLLKEMFLSDEEAPDLSSIEEAIKNRRPYLPKNKIPLISARSLNY